MSLRRALREFGRAWQGQLVHTPNYRNFFPYRQALTIISKW
jgi:hypothetical protein